MGQSLSEHNLNLLNREQERTITQEQPYQQTLYKSPFLSMLRKPSNAGRRSPGDLQVIDEEHLKRGSALNKSIDDQRLFYPEHTSLITDTYNLQMKLQSKGKKRYQDFVKNSSNVPIEHAVNVSKKLNQTIDSFYYKKNSLDYAKLASNPQLELKEGDDSLY